MEAELHYLERALPLRVAQVDVQDPVVTISGDGWYLGILCPWTLTGPGISFDTESDPTAPADAVAVLRDQLLDSVTFDVDLLVDPVFHFESGYDLSVHADSDLDPWVFSIPGVVLVGRAQGPGTPA